HAGLRDKPYSTVQFPSITSASHGFAIPTALFQRQRDQKNEDKGRRQGGVHTAIKIGREHAHGLRFAVEDRSRLQDCKSSKGISRVSSFITICGTSLR